MAVESENLAAYHAQTLQALLFNALMFGVTENDASDGQLKVISVWTPSYAALNMRIPMPPSGGALTL